MEQFTHAGYTIKIHQDEDAPNPRKEFDHICRMACWHRRYELGDEMPTEKPDEFLKSLPKGTIVRGLSMLDHSGLHIYLGHGEHWTDSGGWDSGPIGFIYATPEAIRKEYSVKRITDATKKRVEACMKDEVEEYDQYLRGDVYGYEIEDENGAFVDSCWGFFGYDYCVASAKEAAEYAAKNSSVAAGI